MKTIFDAVLEARNSTETTFEPSRKPEPVDAMPGTFQKILAMKRRVERGEHIWHDDDFNRDIE